MAGCLHGGLGPASEEFHDFHYRQFLAVPTLALGILSAALLESDGFGRAFLLHDLAGDGHAFQKRQPDLRHAFLVEGQYFLERQHVTRLPGHGHDGDLILGGNTILFATGFDNCEHRFSSCSTLFLALRPKSFFAGANQR